MEPQSDGHPLSSQITDIYGRSMGEIVGLTFDLEGKIESIGVSESAGRFTVYPGNRILKHESEIVVIPEWRAEAQNLARQRDALSKREKAIEDLARSHDLDPRAFEEMTAQIQAARATLERLGQKVSERLTEIETRHRKVSDFVEATKVQRATAEIDEWTYSVMTEFARTQLETDSTELEELRSAMRYLEDIETKDPLPTTEGLPQPGDATPPVSFDLFVETIQPKAGLATA